MNKKQCRLSGYTLLCILRTITPGCPNHHHEAIKLLEKATPKENLIFNDTKYTSTKLFLCAMSLIKFSAPTHQSCTSQKDFDKLPRLKVRLLAFLSTFNCITWSTQANCCHGDSSVDKHVQYSHP